MPNAVPMRQRRVGDLAAPPTGQPSNSVPCPRAPRRSRRQPWTSRPPAPHQLFLKLSEDPFLCLIVGHVEELAIESGGLAWAEVTPVVEPQAF